MWANVNIKIYIYLVSVDLHVGLTFSVLGIFFKQPPSKVMTE